MYVFYDTEATGLDKDFSQLLQVALVFTDDDFNILATKKVDCRKTPWVVPSPSAMLVTGFTPDDLKYTKGTHYEMMREIEAWIKAQHWPLIFAGYNSLGFDEHALARDLAHNLSQQDLTTAQDPHGQGANTRLDVFPIVKVVVRHMPDALTLENKNEFGGVSLSLLNVAKQNGVPLSDADAHDAMNDIKATIGVAKLLKKIAPEIWGHLASMTTVTAVDAFISKTPVFAYTDVAYGKERSSSFTAVASAGTQAVLFDTSFDPAPYLAMDEAQLADVLRKNFDRNTAGSGPFVLADKDRQPSFMPLDLSGTILPKDFDEEKAAKVAGIVQADADFAKRLASAAQTVLDGRKWQPKTPKAEELFAKPVDTAVLPKIQQWMQDFHGAPDWNAKAALVELFYTDFAAEIAADDTLKRFPRYAGRIVFDNAPDALSDAKRESMMRYAAARMLNSNPKAPYMTIAKARKELAKIEFDRAAGKEKWKDVTDTQIRALKLYYTALEKEFLPFFAQNDNATPAPEVKKQAGKDGFKPE